MIVFVLLGEITVFAEQSTLSASCTESVNVGRSFDVTFTMNSNTNIRAIQFNAYYDSNYISFKSVSAVQSGEVSSYDNNGKVGIAFLKSGTVDKGEVIKLSFTAKTGNGSGVRKVTFESVEAVDSNLNDVKLGMTESVAVNVVKASDSSHSSVSTKSNKSSTSQSTTSKSKSSSDSKSEVAGSRENNVLSPEEEEFYEYVEEYGDSGYSGVEVSRSGNYLRDSIPDKTGNVRYVIFGASGMLLMVMIGLIFYRLGKGRKEDMLFKNEYPFEAEMMFRKYWDESDDDEH